ncbi:MAG: YciI family protein [Hyphomonadaceae bacterium]|nr:YciI family protein [Hyphomonadaceae bacterium]
MQYLLMIYSEEGAWNRLPEAVQKEGLAAYTAYGEALRKAGAMVGANRLRDTADATTVSVTNGKTQVMDGPFAESKEQLGGYYLIEAKNLDEAISWAARCPGAAHGKVEVRPVWSM